MTQPHMNPALQNYIQTHSPDAFRQIVEAQINSVYSHCLRRLGNIAQAEDVTQIVFATLAQHAAKLPANVILEGWLFTTTRFCCLSAQRSAARRLAAEQRAASMKSEVIPSSTADIAAISEIEHLLDDAIAHLGDRDRHALLLRFFAGHSLREVGQKMNVSEDAAKCRVLRAVEKLRRFFKSRGLTADSASIASALAIAVRPAGANLLRITLATSTSATIPISMSTPSIASRFAFPLLKMGAAAMLAAVVVTGSFAMLNNRSAISSAAPATTQSSGQSSPINALRKLAQAMQADDRAAIADCLCGDGLDPDATAAARAFCFTQAAEFRIRRAFLEKFNIEPDPPGLVLYIFPDHGTLEKLLTDTLNSPLLLPATIDGDTARIRVPVPAKEFVDPNPLLRRSAMTHWSGATLVLKQINGDWKLDTDRSINFDITLNHHAGNTDTDLANMAKVYTVGADKFDEIASDIETGVLTTPNRAIDSFEAAVRTAFKSARIDHGSFTPLPMIGG
jgi:RNA polymerase sigma factor (sigma-70 family)